MFLDVLMFNIRTFTGFIAIIYSMVTHGMVLIETKMEACMETPNVSLRQKKTSIKYL